MTELSSLMYLSGGNLPSKWAHSIQIAKMSQAYARKLGANFELVTSGSPCTTFKGMDADFKDWYGLNNTFKLVRVPANFRVTPPYPANYHNLRYCRLATAYACLKAPTLVKTRTFDIVKLLLKQGMPVLWERHEPIAEDDFSNQKLFENDNLIGVVTLSPFLSENYQRKGLVSEKILVAPSAVDLESFMPHQSKSDARSHLSLPQGKKIIVYSGHLYDFKGIPTLLKIAQFMPDFLFILVGGWAEDIDRVRQNCQEMQLKNVHLVGHIPRSQLASYLYAADVLLLPTSKSWNLSEVTSPLKLFEYMAVKRPIVSSALPTIMTVLRDHDNALLADPDNPVSFQAAINNVANNATLANSITERAYKDVQNFTWDKRAEKILEFSERNLRLFCHKRSGFFKRGQNGLKVLLSKV